MANRIEIKSTVSVLPMSADPFEPVRIYDEAKKAYTEEQKRSESGVLLWRARDQVVSFNGTGVQGNVEVAAAAAPHVEALKPFVLKDATLTIWADRRSNGLGVKVSAEVGE